MGFRVFREMLQGLTKFCYSFVIFTFVLIYEAQKIMGVLTFRSIHLRVEVNGLLENRLSVVTPAHLFIHQTQII